MRTGRVEEDDLSVGKVSELPAQGGQKEMVGRRTRQIAEDDADLIRRPDQFPQPRRPDRLTERGPQGRLDIRERVDVSWLDDGDTGVVGQVNFQAVFPVSQFDLHFLFIDNRSRSRAEGFEAEGVNRSLGESEPLRVRTAGPSAKMKRAGGKSVASGFLRSS